MASAADFVPDGKLEVYRTDRATSSSWQQLLVPITSARTALASGVSSSSLAAPLSLNSVTSEVPVGLKDEETMTGHRADMQNALVTRNGSRVEVLTMRSGSSITATAMHVISMIPSYRALPRILALEPSRSLSGANTNVEVQGKNFGLRDSSPWVRLNSTCHSTMSSQWTSDSSISITAPRASKVGEITAELGFKEAREKHVVKISYAPSWSGIKPTHGRPGDIVNIFGVFDARHEHTCVWNRTSGCTTEFLHTTIISRNDSKICSAKFRQWFSHLRAESRQQTGPDATVASVWQDWKSLALSEGYHFEGDGPELPGCSNSSAMCESSCQRKCVISSLQTEDCGFYCLIDECCNDDGEVSPACRTSTGWPSTVYTAASFVTTRILRCAVPQWDDTNCSHAKGCVSQIPLSILSNNHTYLGSIGCDGECAAPHFTIVPGPPVGLLALHVLCGGQAYVDVPPVVLSAVDGDGRSTWNYDVLVQVKVYRLGLLDTWEEMNASKSLANYSTSLMTVQSLARFFGLLPAPSPGKYRFEFQSPGLQGLSIPCNYSETYSNISQRALQMRVISQPTNASAGIVFIPNLAVEIIDAHGMADVEWNHTVAAVLRFADVRKFGVACRDSSSAGNSTTPGIEFSCRQCNETHILFANVHNGVAYFANVSFNGLAGVEFAHFSSAHLSVSSQAIHVAAGCPAALKLQNVSHQCQPHGPCQSCAWRERFSCTKWKMSFEHPIYISMEAIDAMQIHVIDAFGNLAADSAIPISVQLLPSAITQDLDNVAGSLPLLFGHSTITSQQGMAFFQGLHINTKGLLYELIFLSPNLLNVTSGYFDVWPGEAHSLFVVQQPSTPADAYDHLTRQPVVAIHDRGNNTVREPAFEVWVSLHWLSSENDDSKLEQCAKNLTGNTEDYLNGTRQITTQNGHAHFTDLFLGTASGPAYLLFEGKVVPQLCNSNCSAACSKCRRCATDTTETVTNADSMQMCLIKCLNNSKSTQNLLCHQGVLSVTSDAFEIRHLQGVDIEVDNCPADLTAAVALGYPVPTIRVVDVHGNTVLDANMSVSVQLYSIDAREKTISKCDTKICSAKFRQWFSHLRAESRQQTGPDATVASVWQDWKSLALSEGYHFEGDGPELPPCESSNSSAINSSAMCESSCQRKCVISSLQTEDCGFYCLIDECCNDDGEVSPACRTSTSSHAPAVEDWLQWDVHGIQTNRSALQNGTSVVAQKGVAEFSFLSNLTFYQAQRRYMLTFQTSEVCRPEELGLVSDEECQTGCISRFKSKNPVPPCYCDLDSMKQNFTANSSNVTANATLLCLMSPICDDPCAQMCTVMLSTTHLTNQTLFDECIFSCAHPEVPADCKTNCTERPERTNECLPQYRKIRSCKFDVNPGCAAQLVFTQQPYSHSCGGQPCACDDACTRKCTTKSISGDAYRLCLSNCTVCSSTTCSDVCEKKCVYDWANEESLQRCKLNCTRSLDTPSSVCVADKVGNILNQSLTTSVQGAIGFVALEADFPCTNECRKNCSSGYFLNSSSGWRLKRCLFDCSIARFRYLTAPVQLVHSCSSLSHLLLGPSGTYKLIAASYVTETSLQLANATGHGGIWEHLNVTALTNQSFFECQAPYININLDCRSNSSLCPSTCLQKCAASSAGSEADWNDCSISCIPLDEDCNSTDTCSNGCAVQLAASGDRSTFALCIYKCLFTPSANATSSNESTPTNCMHADSTALSCDALYASMSANEMLNCTANPALCSLPCVRRCVTAENGTSNFSACAERCVRANCTDAAPVVHTESQPCTLNCSATPTLCTSQCVRRCIAHANHTVNITGDFQEGKTLHLCACSCLSENSTRSQENLSQSQQSHLFCHALPAAGVWQVASTKFTSSPGLASTVQIVVQPRGSLRECVSSHLWRDSWGYSCDAYRVNPTWCGFERSRDQCCECGGGSGEKFAAESNVPLITQPLVQIIDACGNPVTFFIGFVTVNASSADGTEALSVVGGARLAPNLGPSFVQFTDLAILEARDAVRLQFFLDFRPLAIRKSEPFEVIKGSVVNATLVIDVQPSSSQAMSILPAQPRISIKDAGGNHLEISGATMVSTLVDAHGEHKELMGTRIIPVEGGVATFTDLSVDIAAASYVLEFCFYTAPVNAIFGRLYLGTLSHYPCVATGTSAKFNISVGAPCKLNPVLSRHPALDTLLIKAGEPFETLDLQVQDCGGNLISDYAENANVELYEREVSVHHFDCFGSGSCLTELPDITELLPAPQGLVSALLDMEVVCTDFDFVTEKIERISLGSTVLRGNVGPWPGCFGRCMKTEKVLSQYDVTALVQNGAVPLLVEASKDVDLYPCNGYSLVVHVALTLVAAAPYSQQEAADLLIGPRRLSFTGSLGLPETSIRGVGAGYMLSFQSLTGLRNGSISWISVTYGEPEQLSIRQQPSNGTGGTPLRLQPRIEVLDLGGARVMNSSVFVLVSLVSEHALKLGHNLLVPQMMGTTAVQVVKGFASFTDLAVNVAARDYYLNFSTISARGDHFLSLSSSFSIFIGPPTALAVVRQPLSWTLGGEAIPRQPSVIATDDGGNPTYACSFQVSAQIFSNGAISGQLSGNTTAASVPSPNILAVANFTDLSLDRAGAGYTLLFRASLSAECGGLQQSAVVESAGIHVLVGAPYQLVIHHQPTAGVAGTALDTQPMVLVADRGGNLVEASALHNHWNVCVALLPRSQAHHNLSAATHQSANCSGGDQRLTGTRDISTQHGKAYFYNLGIMVVGEGLRLHFSAQGLRAVVSEPFSVAMPANASQITGQLTLELSRQAFGEAEQRTLVLALAALLGVNPADVTLDEMQELQVSRRRHLLGEGLLVSFRVLLRSVDQQQRAQQLSAGGSYVQAFEDALSSVDGGQFLGLRILDLKIVVQALLPDNSDRWSGFWTLGASTPAGIIFQASTGDLQMLVGAAGAEGSQASSALSCAGTGDSSRAALICFSALGESVGAASLRSLPVSSGAMEAVVTLARRRHSPIEQAMGAQIVSETISLPATGGAETMVPAVQLVAVSDTREVLAANVSLFQVVHNGTSGMITLAKAETLPQSQGVVAVAHVSHFGDEFLVTVSHFSQELDSYALPSIVYRLHQNAEGAREWVPVQTYYTYGATQVVSFRINRDVFLAIANYYNGSSHHVQSEVVRFSVVDAQGQYTPVPILRANQSIATVGARAVAQFHGTGSPAVRDEMLLFTSEHNDTIHFLVWDRDAAQFVTCQNLVHVRPTSVAVTTATSGTLIIGIASALQDVAVFSTVGRGVSRQLVKRQSLATGPGDYLRALTLRIHISPTPESRLQDAKCFANVRYGLQLEASAHRTPSSVYCIMDSVQEQQEGEFDLLMRLPTQNATSLMSITVGDSSLIVSGNTHRRQNGGGGLDIYVVRDQWLTRDANNLQVVSSILPFADDLETNQNYTVSVRLRNGEEGAATQFARSACACILEADSDLGNDGQRTGPGSVARFDARGVAVFKNVSFTVPCVAQRLVFVNPFLSSASAGPFRVSPPHVPGSTEPLELSKLLISSVTAAGNAPQLESGKPFQASLRRVDCWGQDAAWPLPSRSITATSLTPHAQLWNAVTDDLDPAGVQLDFTNLEIQGSGTRIFVEFSAPGFRPARTSLTVAQSVYWQQPLAQTATATPSTPTALSHVLGASAVSYGGKVLVFGGHGGSGLVARTTVIDAAADEVYVLNVSGVEPSPRWQHSAARAGGSMWVFGGLGLNNSDAGGMFELLVESGEWIDWSTALLQRDAPSYSELGRKPRLACTPDYVVVSASECSSNASASIYVMRPSRTAAAAATNASLNASWTRVDLLYAPFSPALTRPNSRQEHLWDLAAMTSDGVSSFVVLLSRNYTAYLFHPATASLQYLGPAVGPREWRPLGSWRTTIGVSIVGSRLLVVEHTNVSAGRTSGVHMSMLDLNLNASSDTAQNVYTEDVNAHPSWVPVHQMLQPATPLLSIKSAEISFEEFHALHLAEVRGGRACRDRWCNSLCAEDCASRNDTVCMYECYRQYPSCQDPLAPTVSLATAALNAKWVLLLVGDADTDTTALASVGSVHLASTQRIQHLAFSAKSIPRGVTVGSAVLEPVRVKILVGDRVADNHDQILVRISAVDVATGRDLVLSGTTALLSQGGEASFKLLRVYAEAGTRMVFRAKTFGVAPVLSSECDVVAGPVARILTPLSVLTWPFQAQPQIHLIDVHSNRVLEDSWTRVTATLQQLTPGGWTPMLDVLQGGLVGQAMSGSVTWSDLSFSRAPYANASSARIVFSSFGLPDASCNLTGV